MIEYLRGKVLATEENHLILDVRGVGYGLWVPKSTLDRLPLSEPDKEASLYVTTVVREDAITLYGFRTREEKSVFDIFLNVSGIGPRTALDVLSTVSIPDFVSAIRTGNVNVITRVPGIGRKKAERLIVELKDKLKLFPSIGPEIDKVPAAESPAIEGDLFGDALAGMQALGYKQNIASRAVAAALREAGGSVAGVEELIKRALQQMTR